MEPVCNELSCGQMQAKQTEYTNEWQFVVFKALKAALKPFMFIHMLPKSTHIHAYPHPYTYTNTHTEL